MFRFEILFAIWLAWIQVSSAKSRKCFQSMEKGNCLLKLKRYFYNGTSDKCEEFTYSGCGQSENNFKTIAACQTECADVCKLPKKSGPCEAAIPRFYYNKMTGTCEPFSFGGCQPNGNNFETIEDCKGRCPDINKICLEPEDKGVRSAELAIRWRFDIDEWACVPFVFLGKGGNSNQFLTRQECKGSCPIGDLCMLPVAPGPCGNSRKRWHYDAISGQCNEFQFGGCLGNANNFESKLDCQLRCPETSICNLPKAGEYKKGDMMNGKEIEPLDRFYYDAERESCRYFKYKGFGGNENNFDTGEKCKLTCPVLSKCILKKDRGFSKKYALKWYFDADEMKCRDFIYYGEGGNDNRFSSKRECQDDCGGCNQPKARGPCLAFHKRFYYDLKNNTCQSFVFGGCQANANNFDSVEECIESCVS